MFLEHFALIISVLCLGPRSLFPDDFLTQVMLKKLEWGGGCLVPVMSDSWGHPLGYSPSGFSVHGIPRQETLESGAATSSSIE